MPAQADQLFTDPGRNEVWDRICRHTDGLSVATTLVALDEHGVLADLVGDPVPLARLAGRCGANPGFLLVALRLLADQGWVTLSGDPDDPRPAVTDTGRSVFALAGHYRHATGFLASADRLVGVLQGQVDPDFLGEWTARLDAGWSLPRLLPDHVRSQVRAHLDAQILAPLMAARARVDGTGDRPSPTRPFAAAGRAAELRVLRTQGWATGSALTEAGRFAVRCAPQYWYPVSYLPTFRGVEELIFGDPVPPRLGEAETHVDRELDLHFSAAVFRATCRTPVLSAVTAVFDSTDLARQPAAVVDIGCGDGAVLREIYAGVRDHTERGRRLGERPLLMVGAEPSEVGRRMTERGLAAEGADRLVLPGDISDPAGLGRALRAHGIDPADVLWVTKSVIHDRDYRAADRVAVAHEPPPTCLAYPHPDGSVITTRDIATSLVGVLSRWTPMIRRHGFLVVEAHQVPPSVTASRLGLGVTTALDATHGYSCQYPVPPEVFAWAVAAAGWRSAAHAEPGADRLGYVTLTVDHFRVAG